MYEKFMKCIFYEINTVTILVEPFQRGDVI